MGGRESKASQRRVEAAVRHQKALALRLEGKTYDQIAEACNYASDSGARKAVETELQRIRDVTLETAEDLMILTLQQLDMIWGSAWETAQATRDPKAFGTCIKVLDRRAKLMGLDKPIKSELTGPNGQPLMDLTGLLLSAAEEHSSEKDETGVDSE